MRVLWDALQTSLLIIATVSNQTVYVVAFAQDNSNSLNDEAEAPTIKAAGLTDSVDSTKYLFNQANENLALDSGDIPAIPFLPSLSGSGEMNYGSNVLDDIIRQIWRHPFDTQLQPKPNCKKRKIAWRNGGPFKTFAFCCLKGPPRPTGPRVHLNNPRLPYRRRRCFLWEPTERCTPDTINCCFCADDRRNGFECEKYYTDEGELAPVSPKRDLKSMLGMQQDDAPNEPTSAFPPAEMDGHYSIAMDIGAGGKRPGRPRGYRKEWTCEPEFQMSQGVVPHNVKIDPLDERIVPWQDYDEKDEDDGDTYEDLIPPHDWPFK
ncbi:hypothetical protein MMC07_000139 [Pseudocyphellaria aurata]|nr:hypothetical protein [Pseudocyphellaria aurata]